MPDEYWVWQLVKETGWTLEYIDALSMESFHDWLQVRDAEMKARKSNGV